MICAQSNSTVTHQHRLWSYIVYTMIPVQNITVASKATAAASYSYKQFKMSTVLYRHFALES